MATVTHPSNQSSSKTALKFRFKFSSNHLSIAKVADSAVIDGSETNPSASYQKPPKISDDPFVDEKINGTQPSHVSDPSLKKSRKIKFRVKSSNISIHSSMVKEDDADPVVAGETNASESNPACKGESSLVASVDEPTVINVPEAVKKNEKKRRFFSVTLSREEIEEDVAAIEALSGGKRLRRLRKRDLPRSQADQRRLERLFPGLEYLGFQ